MSNEQLVAALGFTERLMTSDVPVIAIASIGILSVKRRRTT
jgi:hypothetical protein